MNAILDLLDASKPILVSDLIEVLRDLGWRNLPRRDVFEDGLRGMGVHMMARTHGAGLAVYVAVKPFAEVPNPRPYRGPATYPVRPY